MPFGAGQGKSRGNPPAAASAGTGAGTRGLRQFGSLIGAGEGNRTLVISLEGFCSTIELHPRDACPTGGATGVGVPAWTII